MGKKRKLKKDKIASRAKNRINNEIEVSKDKNYNVHTRQIKRDLLKTLALSVLAIGIVLVLYWVWI
jgi:hypothetical protein